MLSVYRTRAHLRNGSMFAVHHGMAFQQFACELERALSAPFLSQFYARFPFAIQEAPSYRMRAALASRFSQGPTT